MYYTKKRHEKRKTIFLLILSFLGVYFFNSEWRIISIFDNNFDKRDLKEINNSQAIFEWYKTWGSGELDMAFSIKRDFENNIYIAGYTRSYGAGGEDLFLLKYNNLGTLQWNITWGNNERETQGHIAVDSKGYIYLVGYKVYGNGDINICLIKYNSSGQKEWEKIWGYTTSSYLIPEDIAVDSKDNIYITGYRYNVPSDSVDLLIIELDSSGNEKWSYIWDEGTNEVGRGIAFDSSDNIYITGQKASPNYNIILLKLSNSGDFQWDKT